jgi:hypothetical protein
VVKRLFNLQVKGKDTPVPENPKKKDEVGTRQ